jgi:hypothetical protein
VKKSLLLTFVFILAFQTLCFAAVSGAKPSRPSTPPPLPSASQAAPAPAPTNGYKPSAPASSYSDKAPAVQPSAPANMQQPASGGFMRNLGMLGGGMLLGSMLGGMFGFGNSGMFSSLLGMLFTAIPIVGIIMLGRFLWDRYKKNQAKQ